MKRISTPIVLIMILALFVLVIVPKVQAAEECSNASLQGSFGVTSTGTIVGVGPLAAVGVVTFDGQGNHVGFDTISFNGSIARMNFGGTYKVNSDCTGSDTENFQGGPTIHRDFVIVDEGREIRFIVTDSGNAVTAVAKRKTTPSDAGRFSTANEPLHRRANCRALDV
jgi:hypothetical protein